MLGISANVSMNGSGDHVEALKHLALLEILSSFIKAMMVGTPQGAPPHLLNKMSLSTYFLFLGQKMLNRMKPQLGRFCQLLISIT